MENGVIYLSNYKFDGVIKRHCKCRLTKRATVNGVTVQKNVWVGKPVVSISGPASVSQWRTEKYDAVLSSNLSAPSSYQWFVVPQNGDILNQLGQVCYITFGGGNFCRVVVQATNACGAGNNGFLDVYMHADNYSMAYPNPASNTLNIEINQEVYAQAKSSEQTISGAKQQKTDPAFDIRLYDGQGNIVQRAQNKGGTAQFNVSNLPAGIYYLHVYDGISDKPEVQQIMVER